MIKRLNPSHRQNFRAREGPCPLPSYTQPPDRTHSKKAGAHRKANDPHLTPGTRQRYRESMNHLMKNRNGSARNETFTVQYFFDGSILMDESLGAPCVATRIRDENQCMNTLFPVNHIRQPTQTKNNIRTHGHRDAQALTRKDARTQVRSNATTRQRPNANTQGKRRPALDQGHPNDPGINLMRCDDCDYQTDHPARYKVRLDSLSKSVTLTFCSECSMTVDGPFIFQLARNKATLPLIQ